MKKTSGNGPSVGGITITHPDRIIFPDKGITKQQLAEYYLAVADDILPYVKNRPLSIIRCPQGISEACFFQRHIGSGKVPYLHDTGVKVKGRSETYMMIKDVKGLISLIQWNVVELHPWGCLADQPDKPDRMIFDLDPDPALPWRQVVEAAMEVRARLNEFGLKSFAKTTGGKGLHVVVPLARSYGWPAVKAFARAIAESMAHDEPGRYIAKAAKAARKGKIFVDYLRNDLTSTAVAPFSVRARPGATVAMPLEWEELKRADPAAFTVETTLSHLKRRRRDPWSGFNSLRQKISARYLSALGIAPE